MYECMFACGMYFVFAKYLRLTHSSLTSWRDGGTKAAALLTCGWSVEKAALFRVPRRRSVVHGVLCALFHAEALGGIVFLMGKKAF